MIFRKKDSDARFFHGMHFSDYGVILIAALLTAAAVYLLVTPEDYGAEFSKAAKALTAPASQQAAPGEAPAMIFNSDKKK